MRGKADSPTALFVDLTDSTGLYERLGDERAREYIGEAIARWEEIVEKSHGRLVKRIGDELLCVFERAEDGAIAAMDIQTALTQISDSSEIELNAKIGLHHGPFLEVDGDVFGDTVNLAARLVSLARPRQILTTTETVEALPPAYRMCAKWRDRVAIKGKTGEYDIHELVWEINAQTDVAPSRAIFTSPSHCLILRAGDQSMKLDAESNTARIGRQSHNDLVVSGTLVSRSHARIVRRRHRFVLVDESTNGSWLANAGGEARCLRQDEITLSGKGLIGFGEAPEDGAGHTVSFEVVEIDEVLP